MATALCPGSFDPVTLGHLDIIERSARHFDEVIVAVIRNPQKTQSLFSLEERQQMLEGSAVAHLGNMRIEFFKGLLVEFAKRARRPGDRQGPARRLRLRLRAADGADEPAALGHRHVLPLDQPAATRSCRRASCARSRASAATCRAWCPKHVNDRLVEMFRGEGGVTVLEDEPEKVPDTAVLLASCARCSRTRAQAADVGVGLGQPRRVRRDPRRTRSTGLPEELREARWLLKERDQVLERGRARGRPADRGGAGPRRAHGREERGRPRGPPHLGGDPRGRRAPGRRRSATRPRTTSTASSRRSRSCSTARCSRCRRAASGSQVHADPSRSSAEPDDPSDDGAFFDQDEG